MGKEDKIHSQNGILLTSETELTTDTCSNMHGFQKYYRGNETDTKYCIPHDFIDMKFYYSQN